MAINMAINFLEDAHILVQGGEMKKAISIYQLAIEQNPSSCLAYYYQGNALGLLERYEEAVISYRQAISINPKLACVHHNLGKALVKLAKLEEATFAFFSAIEIEPNSWLFYNSLGELLAEKGEFSEAATYYQKAIEINHYSSWLYANLGWVTSKQGLLEDGIALYRQAIYLNPNVGEFYKNLGMVLTQAGKINEALETYRKAIDINDSILDCQDMLALLEKAFKPLDDEFEDVPCYICSGLTEKICETGQFDLPTHVSICQGCGLVFLSPRWTKKQYQRFYEKEYDRYYRPHVLRQKTKLIKPTQQASVKEKVKPTKVAMEILSRLKSYNSGISAESILDIGCGTGSNVGYLGQELHSEKVAGIESSIECASIFQNVIGGELLGNDVDSAWHIGHRNRFDLAIMRHTLEHFLDPASVLRKLAYVLKQNGLLYIAVPDMMSPYDALQKKWFRVVHTYYFSANTLERTLSMANLKPLTLKSVKNELWGIFTVGKHTPKLISVYTEQWELIQSKLKHQKST